MIDPKYGVRRRGQPYWVKLAPRPAPTEPRVMSDECGRICDTMTFAFQWLTWACAITGVPPGAYEVVPLEVGEGDTWHIFASLEEARMVRDLYGVPVSIPILGIRPHDGGAVCVAIRKAVRDAMVEQSVSYAEQFHGPYGSYRGLWANEFPVGEVQNGDD